MNFLSLVWLTTDCAKQPGVELPSRAIAMPAIGLVEGED